MANRFHITRPHQSAGTWDADQALDRALAERDRFLAQYPKYRAFQNEIDGILDKAGSSENRMAVLALLMESKLIELHGQLQHLNRILMATRQA